MKFKILVVDDERDTEFLFNQMFRKELNQNLFEFIFQFSVTNALEWLNKLENKEKLILVLSDINIPGKNGIDLLKQIKTHINLICPVYLFTAFDEDEKRSLAQQFNVDKYLRKPIDFVELKDDILRLIKS